MPVAKAQMPELMAVVQKYAPAAQVPALVRDLQQTAAYQANESFRKTVDRMLPAPGGEPQVPPLLRPYLVPEAQRFMGRWGLSLDAGALVPAWWKRECRDLDVTDAGAQVFVVWESGERGAVDVEEFRAAVDGGRLRYLGRGKGRR